MKRNFALSLCECNHTWSKCSGLHGDDSPAVRPFTERSVRTLSLISAGENPPGLKDWPSPPHALPNSPYSLSTMRIHNTFLALTCGDNGQ